MATVDFADLAYLLKQLLYSHLLHSRGVYYSAADRRNVADSTVAKPWELRLVICDHRSAYATICDSRKKIILEPGCTVDPYNAQREGPVLYCPTLPCFIG